MMFRDSTEVELPFDVEAYLEEVIASTKKPCSLAQSITDAVNARLKDEFLLHLIDRVEAYKPLVAIVTSGTTFLRGDNSWATISGKGISTTFHLPAPPNSSETIKILLSNSNIWLNQSHISCQHQKNLIIHTTHKLIEELQKIVSIQPMKSPVSQVYQKVMDMRLSPDMPIHQLKIESVIVEAKSRTYKTQIPDQFFDHGDLQKQYNHVSTLLATEIIQDILVEMVSKSDHRAIKLPVHDFNNNIKVFNSNLIEAIVSASYTITNSTRNGKNHFIICSPSTLYALTTQPSFIQDVTHPAAGILAYQGNLMGLEVYSTFLVADDEVVIGQKGSDDLDSGYIYAPYVPVMPYVNMCRRDMVFGGRSGSVISKGDNYIKLKLFRERVQE